MKNSFLVKENYVRTMDKLPMQNIKKKEKKKYKLIANVYKQRE